MTIRPDTATTARNRWSWLVGLRARLVVAFLVVALGSGLAAAGLSYVSARNAILDERQVQFLDQVRDRVGELASRPGPPRGSAMDVQLAERLDVENVVVLYGERQTGSLRLAQIPAELRDAVRQRGRLSFQRTAEFGESLLYVGTPVETATGSSTGIEVYAVTSLSSQQESIQALTRQAAIVLGTAAAVALAIALVAAHSVLRPVRALSRGAARLGSGALDTRLPVRGNDELAELVRSFNHAAARLQDSVTRLKREEANSRRFVADVSHELRTPLAAMTAVTDTLDEESARLGGDGEIAARVLSTETLRLAELVENLIEISRFDAGRAELDLQEVDARDAVDRAIATRGWDGAATVRAVPGAGRSAVRITADPRRLDVVIANLVGNAVRHGTPPITVTVADIPTPGKNEVTITVHDSGPGMPAEVRRHVFSRFYKADATRSRSEGSGLGLAIAWENVQLHGGRIEVTSAAGEGTRFTVRLPREGRR